MTSGALLLPREGFVVKLHATFGSPHLHCQTQLIQSAPPKPAQLLRSQEKGEKKEKESSLNYQREPCAAKITWERFIIDFVQHPKPPPVALTSPLLLSFLVLFMSGERGKKVGNKKLAAFLFAHLHVKSRWHVEDLTSERNP